MKHRTIRLAAVLVLLTTPAWAVSTTPTVLTSAWQDLGAGPLMVQSVGGTGVYAVADATPSAGTAGFGLNDGAPFSFCGTSHVYARRGSTAATQRVVALATTATSCPAGNGASSIPVTPTQGTTWTQNADVACAATTLCTLSSASSRKYFSATNTTATGYCRIGYGGVSPTASRGDPLANATAAGGQGGNRTFETAYVPSGTVQAFCTVASTIAVMEGN